jgi:hypothetical protein
VSPDPLIEEAQDLGGALVLATAHDDPRREDARTLATWRPSKPAQKPQNLLEPLNGPPGSGLSRSLRVQPDTPVRRFLL